MLLRSIRASFGKRLPSPPLTTFVVVSTALLLLGRSVIGDLDLHYDGGFADTALAFESVVLPADRASDLAAATDRAPNTWQGPRVSGGAAPFTCGAVISAAALAADRLASLAIEVAKAATEATPKLPFEPLSEPTFAAGPTPGSVARPHEASAETAAGAQSRRTTGVFANLRSPEALLRDAGHTREISHRIRSGETISQVLDSHGVPPQEVGQWLRAADRVYNLDHVYAGQQVSLLVDTRSRSLTHLALEIDRKSLLVANRDGGDIVAERREVPHFRRTRAAGGEIQSSLYMAAMSQGIPDRIVSEMAEILGWELDFARDVRPGATFRVVYEEFVRLDTHESIAGRVLAVDVTNRGTTHEGYWFEPADAARGGYYNRAGDSLGRAFLRYPVEYSRISSHFSTKRFHPIKKIPIPHYGVDFAAPPGTPVVAAADGEVIKSGWYGGNGRLVKLSHGASYQSAYAHLSRIETDVVAGAKVKKGQVIGYVGSTGLATGPHLHFAMYRNGGYIDPLTAELPREPSLTGAALQSFAAGLTTIDRRYAKAGLGGDGVAQLATFSEE